MAITYKIDETFTGKRTTSMPDPDNEGETIDEENDEKVFLLGEGTVLSL